jgi:hypothetical protein
VNAVRGDRAPGASPARWSAPSWIITCLRAGPGPVARPHEHDWDATLARAEREDLLPALAWAFRDATDAIPPGISARLASALRDARARHAVMLSALRALLDAFHGAGVAVVPLKGPALAEMLYPDPALRPCHDLDLLVFRNDRHVAGALLEALGYRHRADLHTRDFDLAFDGAAAYDGRHGVRVDLHWSLLGEARFTWQRTEEAGVWQRLEVCTIARARVPLLAREDLLLALAAHLAIHHAAAGLKWYWDIARLVEGGVDWRVVVERATAWRVRRALGLVLERAEAWFGVRVPAEVRAFVPADGLRARAARWLTDRDGTRTAGEYALPLLLTDAPGDAVRQFARVVAPAPAWLRARYGHRSLPGLYIAHGHRLAAIAREAAIGRSVPR